MAGEIINDELNVRKDLSDADLSKVDTFALGVILINMLTGGYLFKSCEDEEYQHITTSFDYLFGILHQKITSITEPELIDLTVLLQGMLHPDPNQRLSIEELTSESGD